MKAEKISDVLDMLDEDLVAEADRLRRRRESRRGFQGKVGSEVRGEKWAKWGILAASVCLLLWGAVYTLLRFDYLKMGCSAMPGTIADGVYYYHVSHDGVYAYRPVGESEKLLSVFWEDGWLVNGYGLYYCKGKSLYVCPHGSKKSIKLHTEKKSTHIGFSLQPDGNVMVTAYHKRKELIWQNLLDGKTGEVLERVMEPTPYETYYKLGKYSDYNFVVGDREVQLVSAQELSGLGFSGNTSGFRLFENGESILPEDIWLYRGEGRCFYAGDTLVLSGYRDEIGEVDESEPGQEPSSVYQGEDEEKEELLILLRPDRNDSILAAQIGFYYYSGGTDFFLFYPYLDGVWCHSLEDGSHWELETEGDTAVSFYSIQTDGNYLYSCAPWDHIQECWRVEYDSAGRPVKLVLVDADITANAR